MVKINFGRHKGSYVSDIKDIKYLRYLATNNARNTGADGEFKVPEDVEKEARRILGGTDNNKPSETRPRPLEEFVVQLDKEIAIATTNLSNTEGDESVYNAGLVEGLELAKKLYTTYGA